MNKNNNRPFDRLSKYDFLYLVEHLIVSGKSKELHKLLSIELQEKHNAWYEAKQNKGNLQSYLNDINSALLFTEIEYLGEDSLHNARNLELLMHYSLIISSINSISTKISPDFLNIAIVNKYFDPLQGLAYAHQVPEKNQRAEMLIAIAPHLSEDLRRKILEEALSLINELYNPKLSIKILPHIQESAREPICNEILSISQTIENEFELSSLLTELIPYLKDDQLIALLKVVQNKLQNIDFRTDVLEQIASYANEKLLEEVVIVAGNVRNEYEWPGILSRIAPYLSEHLTKKTLQKSKDMENELNKVQAISVLIPYLSTELQKTSIEYALETARAIKWEWIRSLALATLIPNLNDELRSRVLSETLETVWQVQNKSNRTRTLLKITPYLRGEVFTKALREILNETKKNSGTIKEMIDFSGIIPLMTRALLLEAIGVIVEFKDSSARTFTLMEFVPRLEGELKEKALKELTLSAKIMFRSEFVWLTDNVWFVKSRKVITCLMEAGQTQRALDVIQESHYDDLKALLLIELAETLSGSMLQVAWGMVRSAGKVEYEIKFLTRLDSQLSTELLTSVTPGIQMIEDFDSYCNAILMLIPYLPKAPLYESIPAITAIEDTAVKDNALKKLALRLVEIDCPQDAVLFAEKIVNPISRIEALIDLVIRIKDPVYKKAAFDKAQKLWPSFSKNFVQYIVDAIPQLSEDWQEYFLNKTLVKVKGMRFDIEHQSKCLIMIAPYLNRDMLVELLADARKLGGILSFLYSEERVSILVNLAPNLAKVGEVNEAFKIVHEIEDADIKLEVLSSLAPYLSKNQLHDLLINALGIQDPDKFANATKNLVCYLTEDLIQAYYIKSKNIEWKETKVNSLLTLIPRAPESLLSQIVTEILSTSQNNKHHVSMFFFRRVIGQLADLAKYLTDEITIEVVSAAKKDGDDLWLYCLNRVAPHIKNKQILNQIINDEVKRISKTSGVFESNDNLIELKFLLTNNPLLRILDGNSISKIKNKVLKDTISQRIYYCLVDDNMLEEKTLFYTWKDLVHIMASYTRAEYLSNIGVLLPFVIFFGGERIIIEIYNSINTTRRWWP